ncbi:MAG: histidine kinase [Bacteroidaceae bacterium]|nr:histidine kinase [Bacteroidaceae bacterium]
MNQIKLKIDWSDIIMQVVIVSIMFFIPMLVMAAIGRSWLQAFFDLKYALPPLFTLLGGFLINYYWLVPRFLIEEHSWLKYSLACIACYALLKLGSHQLGYFIYSGLDPGIFSVPNIPTELAIAFELGVILMNFLLILAAWSLRFRQRNRQLELIHAEQAKEQAQSELLRLKGQLNPHFLFNTLNNISSLSAIDTDAAQESISRLSEMLRYVLYDSSTERVSLKKDVDFMLNYINLMQIRYEDTLKLDVQMQVNDPDRQIPPMLFISLLENAYKYGASSLHDCWLRVKLTDEGGSLRFLIENTLLTEQEMASKKRGGVGLENLAKRLLLMYSDHHTFTYGETADGSFRAEIVITE